MIKGLKLKTGKFGNDGASVQCVHNYNAHNVHGAGPYSLLRIRCHLSGLHSVAGKCALMEVA